MPVLWTSEAPCRPLRSEIGLLAVDQGEAVLCRKLGPCWWADCHWCNGRSIICTGAEECRVHQFAAVTKGFMPVQTQGRSWRGKSPGLHLAVLVVTAEIGADVVAYAMGLSFTVSRRAGKANNPLSVAVTPKQPVTPLPETFDPRPFVLRAMGLTRKFAGQLRVVS